MANDRVIITSQSLVHGGHCKVSKMKSRSKTQSQVLWEIIRVFVMKY